MRNRIQYDGAIENNLRLSMDEIRSLVFAGSRVGKRSTAQAILDQIDFYLYVLQRGFPSKFKSMEEFLAFSDDLKKSFENAGLTGGQVRIFGSSLTKPTARNIDFCLVYSETDYENILKLACKDKIREGGKIVDISKFEYGDFADLGKRIEANPENSNSISKENFYRNYRDGFVRTGEGKKEPEAVFGLKKISAILQNKHPLLELDDFMIVRRSSQFDKHPYIVI